MRSSFIWLPIILCLGLSTFLFYQNRMMSKELNLLRLEDRQSEGLQPKEESAKENDAIAGKPDRELLRLRNEVGLLRERVDSLTQEQIAIRQNLSSSRQDDISPERKKLIAQERETSIRSIETSLVERQQELTKVKQNYLELWKTLNVPDEILNMEASAAFKDPRLKQYWPYFETQKDSENLERIIVAIGLKLEAEKIERNGAK